MGNVHGLPDTMAEIQSICADLLPPCLIFTTGPTVPASGLTVPAFATVAYMQDGTHLVYVTQGAAAVTLSGAAGTFWLLVHRDTSSAVAGWTRQPGTHYLWQSSPTQPLTPNGGILLAQLTVTGTNITAATLVQPATRAAAWRAWLALGTMATQNAHAVAITGGEVSGIAATPGAMTVVNEVGIGTFPVTGYSLVAQYQSRFNATVHCQGNLGVRTAPVGTVALDLKYVSAAGPGLRILPESAGAATPIAFLRSDAGAYTGTISTTDTTTSYNTSSDIRLKHAIAALTGALAVVQALRPVAFRWNVDDSQGHGFLAHELQQVVPDAVTGEPDAVNEDGSVKPQQVDHSKLVPWLTAALQEAVAQVQALAARVASLETQLGV